MSKGAVLIAPIVRRTYTGTWNRAMPSVLIIDDEMTVRAFLREALTEAGYRVVEATDGKEGLDLYRATPTDLVITDLFMEDQEGLETILLLRREFPHANMIAISGGGGEYDDPTFFLQAARKLGAKETLAKPFGVEDLLQTVQKVLKG